MSHLPNPKLLSSKGHPESKPVPVQCIWEMKPSVWLYSPATYIYSNCLLPLSLPFQFSWKLGQASVSKLLIIKSLRILKNTDLGKYSQGIKEDTREQSFSFKRDINTGPLWYIKKGQEKGDQRKSYHFFALLYFSRLTTNFEVIAPDSTSLQ